MISHMIDNSRNEFQVALEQLPRPAWQRRMAWDGRRVRQYPVDDWLRFRQVLGDPNRGVEPGRPPFVPE
jgi:hypothetical protein